MKRKFSVLFAAVLMGIYSCGGSDQNTNSGTSSEKKSTIAESTEPAVDINAKSDSKGLGKFASVTLEPVNPEVAEKGELIFSSQCSACHNVTAERLIGPGLKGITEKRTPEWILNMITNPNENLQKTSLGKALLKEYKAVMPYMGTTDEDARNILEYLRQNDSK